MRNERASFEKTSKALSRRPPELVSIGDAPAGVEPALRFLLGEIATPRLPRRRFDRRRLFTHLTDVLEKNGRYLAMDENESESDASVQFTICVKQS